MLYRVVSESLLLPFRVGQTGEPLGPEANLEQEQMRDQYNRPQFQYYMLSDGQLVSDSAEDDPDEYDFYCFDAGKIRRAVRLNALVEHEANLPEPEADELEPEASQGAKSRAQQLGVDLKQVEGTGHNGQIIKSDVDRYYAANHE